MLKIKEFNKNEEILLSVLEFLDRNGYKHCFEKLQQKTGLNYSDNDKKVIEHLLHLRKIDELILYIRNNILCNICTSYNVMYSYFYRKTYFSRVDIYK